MMDNLRWWLLLIAAVMFSMSGCASPRDLAVWQEHPTHYASTDHLTFSARNPAGNEPVITEADQAKAEAEGWWGYLIPPEPPADVSGRWVGTWHGSVGPTGTTFRGRARGEGACAGLLSFVEGDAGRWTVAILDPAAV